MVKRRSGSLLLKTAHDAEEFMRTRARVSPSWPGRDLRGRIRCSRLISRRSRQNPLQTGRAIRCRRGGPYVFNNIGRLDAFAEPSANGRYLCTARDWNRRIVFSKRPLNLGSDSPRSLAGPPVFLRAMISERRACADSDFICTGLKKPGRARYASPGASLRSVLWVSVRTCS